MVFCFAYGGVRRIAIIEKVGPLLHELCLSLYTSSYCVIDCEASPSCDHRELVIVRLTTIQNTRVVAPPRPRPLLRHPGVRVAGVEIHAGATRGPCYTGSFHATERRIVVGCAGVAF